MTDTLSTTSTTSHTTGPRGEPLARRSGFARDTLTVASRSLRQVRREPATLLAPVMIPIFFFAIFTSALAGIFGHGVSGYRAFQLPVSIVFATTGTTRATALVNDITDGYFDRMMLAPTNRLALLLGLMFSDLFVVVALSIPVLILGLIFGVPFGTGPLGLVLFLGMAVLWGLAFAGIPYAIALRTGNPTAVAQSSLLFFPFVFLTTTLMPLHQLSGWLSAVARANPVTYLLAALRSLDGASSHWDAHALLVGLAVVCGVGVLTFSAALAALRSRVTRS